VWKTRKKIIAYLNYIMRLVANLGHLSRDKNVLALAIWSNECITGQRIGSGIPPCQDGSRVQTTGQRDANLLTAVEVPWKVLRKDGT